MEVSNALIYPQRYPCQNGRIQGVCPCSEIKAIAEHRPTKTGGWSWHLQCDRLGTHGMSGGAFDSSEVVVIGEFSCFDVYFKCQDVSSFCEGVEAFGLSEERRCQE